MGRAPACLRWVGPGHMPHHGEAQTLTKRARLLDAQAGQPGSPACCTMGPEYLPTLKGLCGDRQSRRMSSRAPSAEEQEARSNDVEACAPLE